MSERTQRGRLSFSCSIDEGDEADFYSQLEQFQDANIFQTPAFCAVMTPAGRQERVSIRHGGELVAVAMVRVASAGMGIGLSHVRWGPLWRRRGQSPLWEVWAGAMRALREEYVTRRKLVLRVIPGFDSEESALEPAIFTEHGFTPSVVRRGGRTMWIDLAPTLDELRKGLDKKWRNCLSGAERSGLEIIEGTSDDLFERFLVPYREMLARKQLPEPGDIYSFREIQRRLPAKHKMRVFLCLNDRKVCAGAVVSGMGDMGLYLFGATGDDGTTLRPSYLLQWRVVAWLKENQCSTYDLHGTDASANPGVYAFKRGLCGRNGRELQYIGSLDASDNRVVYAAVRAVDALLPAYRKLRKRIVGVR